MKKIITTFQNIWSIEELRQRILLTIGLVFIFRVGTYIALPGLEPSALINMKQQGTGGILGLVNLFRRWRVLPCFYLCIGYHALYLCFYRSAALDYRGATVSENV